VAFAHHTTARKIAQAAADAGRSVIPVLRRKADKVFITDSGNYIYDCPLGVIADPAALAASLSAIPGVVEHGLFVGLAKVLILARPTGVTVIERKA